MKKRKIMTFVIAAVLALTVGCASAFAAETSDVTDQNGYSYLAGRQRSVSRNDLYAQAEQLPEDEQDEFLAKYGIGETPYSEEAAASYGYVTGQQRGASYSQSDDGESTQDTSGYSFRAGQMRGASYHK